MEVYLMKIYHVYDIKDTIKERTNLNETQLKNLKDIFSDLTGLKIKNKKVIYKIRENNSLLITEYNEILKKTEISSDELSLYSYKLAEKLLQAESVKSENNSLRRNLNIKDGVLFVEHSDGKIIIVKLEGSQIKNRDTFEKIDGLSTDRDYFKLCIFTKDKFDEIIVVDGNNSVAKYWATDFLDLIPKRDNQSNTTNLIDSINKNNIISTSLKLSDEEKTKITKRIEKYILFNQTFNQETIFNSLELTDKTITKNELFNEAIFKNIDAQFNLDKKVIRKAYKSWIKVNEEISIEVNGLKYLIEDELLKLDSTNRELVIKIPGKSIHEIEKQFEIENS